MVTGGRDPQICHVFPFSSLTHPGRTKDALLACLYNVWGPQCEDRLRPLLLGDTNIVDTARNMVALNPHLHHWWSVGTIAFEPVVRLPNGVRLKLRWMRKTEVGLYDQMSLDTDPREVLLHPSGEGSHKIRHYETGRSIQDGEIIDIVSDDPSAAPSMDIWEL